MTRQPAILLSVGQLSYRVAWNWQRRLIEMRRAGTIPDALLLLEHPPTYTIGRSGSRANLLLSEQECERFGIEVVEVDRGGDITYHGPGQCVGYPIFDLRSRDSDVHAFLRGIEEILIRTLADYGIRGERDGRYTGVWLDEQKIAAIGVKVSGGVSSHGFALNIDPSFEHWAGIVPCGIGDRGVTALSRAAGAEVSGDHVRSRLASHAADVFALAFAVTGPEVDSALAALVASPSEPRQPGEDQRGATMMRTCADSSIRIR